MTIEALKSAIKSMSERFMVGQDLFFELLFQEAEDFYCDVYYPALYGKTAAEGRKFFYASGIGTNESVRPRLLELEYFTNSDFDGLDVEAGDYLSMDMYGAGHLKLDAILAYFNQFLLEKPMVKNESIFRKLSVFIVGDSPYIIPVFIPIDELINKLLNPVLIAEKIQRLMANPINSRAYGFDFETIGNTGLIDRINSNLEEFKINIRYCDAFELCLFAMFSNSQNYPTTSFFDTINNHYAKSKIGFTVTIETSENIIDEIVAGINNSGNYIASKESFVDGRGTFFIEYSFALAHVIPRMKETLTKDSEKILALCKMQYKESIKGKSYAKFYDEYYPKGSEKLKCLPTG